MRRADRQTARYDERLNPPNIPSALPAPDDRHWRHLIDEPVRQRLKHAAVESFFSSVKIERIARKTYRTRRQASKAGRVQRFLFHM